MNRDYQSIIQVSHLLHSNASLNKAIQTEEIDNPTFMVCTMETNFIHSLNVGSHTSIRGSRI